MMILALALLAATPADADVATARGILIDGLRDPSKAQVRNWHRVADAGPGNAAFCGELNAPNAYGGMTGWHMARVTVRGAFSEDGGSRLMHDVITETCSTAAGADLTAAFNPAS